MRNALSKDDHRQLDQNVTLDWICSKTTLGGVSNLLKPKWFFLFWKLGVGETCMCIFLVCKEIIKLFKLIVTCEMYAR